MEKKFEFEIKNPPPQESAESTKKTSFQKAKELTDAIRKHAAEHSKSAQDDGDLKEFLRAEMNIEFANNHLDYFEWLHDTCEDEGEDSEYTLKDFLKYQNSEALKKKEEKLTREMYASLKNISVEDPNLVPVSLRRFRVNRDSWQYRVLAHFPSGAEIVNPKFWDLDNTKSDEYLYYSADGIPCANHACDVLYKRIKDQKEEKSGRDFIFLPYISPKQFWEGAAGTKSGTIEFKNPETGELRNAEKEVMRALVGCYTNLTERYRIPVGLLEGEKQQDT